MIGLLVRETICLIRAYKCSHTWDQINTEEEQCQHCKIIVTPEGKKNLEGMARRYNGYG